MQNARKAKGGEMMVRVEEQQTLRLEGKQLPGEFAGMREKEDLTKTDISKTRVAEKGETKKEEGDEKNSLEDSFDNLSFLNYESK